MPPLGRFWDTPSDSRDEQTVTIDMAIERELDSFREAISSVDRDGHTEAVMILRLMAAANLQEASDSTPESSA